MLKIKVLEACTVMRQPCCLADKHKWLSKTAGEVSQVLHSAGILEPVDASGSQYVEEVAINYGLV